MSYRWLGGILLLGWLVAPAAAQTPAGVPAGEASLGSVTIPRAVLADGKPLARGTYRVRLTTESAQPAAPGQAPARWVEFVQGGQVKGREVVSAIPDADMRELFSTAESRTSARSGTRVEMLKGDDYLRIWIARGGVNYLIHLPPASSVR